MFWWRSPPAQPVCQIVGVCLDELLLQLRFTLDYAFLNNPDFIDVSGRHVASSMVCPFFGSSSWSPANLTQPQRLSLPSTVTSLLRRASSCSLTWASYRGLTKSACNRPDVFLCRTLVGMCQNRQTPKWWFSLQFPFNPSNKDNPFWCVCVGI